MQPVHNHPSILVVDGSDIILNRIKMLLQELPGVISIQTAKTLTQAKEILSGYRQDLVLFDIALQEKTGFELLQHIREHSPGTKTMVLTNLTDDIYKTRSREMGADYFIDKSREFDHITRIIREDIADGIITD